LLRRAAKALLHLHHGHEVDVADAITYHLLKGGSDSREITNYAQIAGNRAFSLPVYSEAEHYYRQATEVLKERNNSTSSEFRELGWNRGTQRKGKHEVESGIVCVDGFALRGRKRSEGHLPNLLNDITAIVDGQSQADPQFRTNRLYTRLTATEVRRQLIAQKGYTGEELPTAETIATKLNMLGFYPKKVAKSRPQKNSPRQMPSSPR